MCTTYKELNVLNVIFIYYAHNNPLKKHIAGYPIMPQASLSKHICFTIL